MPISRYQIRSEYSLADPELYRAADRDDPEALLEGVAMAGLVGVLRQLGDLAQFAAEIFHDLHEEVMATSSRGHGLMIRVQQLEAEFPRIEKAFLSQTSHLNFTQNAGIDWRANLQMDQNLVTRGDLPRFIMDSYEECRGAPRLFLLDKFDVAGAGACLKRYSDPSFYKAEVATTRTKNLSIQKEKKARKSKKRGARWRNGDTPEIFSTSKFNSRLHQLLSDEQNSTSEKVPTYGVKLKRRQLNIASFNSRTGRSYMEKIFEMHPPENEITCDDLLPASNLKMGSLDACESGPEIYEIGAEGPANKFMKRVRTPIVSPSIQEVPDLISNELGEDVIRTGKLNLSPEMVPKFDVDTTSAASPQVDTEYEVVGKNKTETSVNGYMSDEHGVEKSSTTFDEKNYTSAVGSKAKSGVSESRSDEFEREKIPTALDQVDGKDELVDGKIKPIVDDHGYMSDEVEVVKTSTTSQLVSQKDVLVDSEKKIQVNADDKHEVEKIPTTFYQANQKKDAFDDDVRETDATTDVRRSDEIKVDKITTVIHQVCEKDDMVSDENKAYSGVNLSMPNEFEAEKIPLTVDNRSRMEAGADGYRSDDFVTEKLPPIFSHLNQKDTLVDDDSQAEFDIDGCYISDDAPSEVDNYMDALTTMESEIETDTETRAKNNLGLLNVVSQETDSDINNERELHGQCSDTHSVGNSSMSFEWNSSFKKERSTHSDSDSFSNLAGLESPQDNGVASLDMAENFESSFRFGDAYSGSLHDSPCFRPDGKSSYSSDGDAAAEPFLSAKVCPAEIHNLSSEKIMNGSDVLGTKSSGFSAPGEIGNEESDSCHANSVSVLIISSPITEVHDASSEKLMDSGGVLGTESMDCGAPKETSNEESDSCYTDAASTLVQSPSASVKEVHPAREDSTEISSSDFEACNREAGEHSGDDFLHVIGFSDLQSQTKEVQHTVFTESYPSETLVGGNHEPSLDASLNASDSTDMPQVRNNDDVLEEVLSRGVTTECTCDDLQVAEICDLSSGTRNDASLSNLPKGYVEDCASPAENVTGVMRDSCSSVTIEVPLHLSIVQDVDACLVGISQPECSSVSLPRIDSIDVLPIGTVTELESGVIPYSEDSKPAVNLQEMDEFIEHEHKKSTTYVLPLESEHLCSGEPLESEHLCSGEPCECHVVQVATSCTGLESFPSGKNGVLSKLELQEEEFLPEGTETNSFHEMGNNSEPVDSLSVSVTSSPPVHMSSAEEHKQSIDLERGSLVVTESNGCCPKQISSLEASDDFTQLEKECLSDPPVHTLLVEDHKQSDVFSQLQEKLLASELANQEDSLESDAREAPRTIHSETEEVLPKSTVPSCSKSTDNFHHIAPSEDGQPQLELSSDSEAHISFTGSSEESVLNLKEDLQASDSESPHQRYPHVSANDLDSKLKLWEDLEAHDLESPYNKYPHECASDVVPSEQGLHLEVGREENVMTLHEEGESYRSLDLRLQRMESPKAMDPPLVGAYQTSEPEMEMETHSVLSRKKCERYPHVTANDLDSKLKLWEDLEAHDLESPYNKYPHECACDVVPSEQGLHLEVGREENVMTLHEEGESYRSLDLRLQRMESPKAMDPPLVGAYQTSDPEMEMETHSVLSRRKCERYPHVTANDLDSKLKLWEDLEAHDLESPYNKYPHECASDVVPSEQGLHLEVGREENVMTLHEEGESYRSSDLRLQRMESPKAMDPPLVGAHQTSEPEIEMETHPVLSRKKCDGLNMSSPESEAFIPSQPVHSLESAELPVSSDSVTSTPAAITSSFSLLGPGTAREESLELQRSRSLGFPVSSDLQEDLESMPPLPPLPPLEWRMGKLRHTSLISGGQLVQPSDSDPLLPIIEGQKHQNGPLIFEGETTWSSNPFASAIEEKKPQHGSPSLGGQTVQSSHSLVPLPMGDEMPLPALDGQVQSSSVPSPVVEDESHSDGLPKLGGVIEQHPDPVSRQAVEVKKPKENYAEDGKPKDVAIEDGKPKDNAIEDGKPKDVAIEDGKPKDNAIEDGKPKDVAIEDGKPKDNAIEDGKAKDNPIEDAKPKDNLQLPNRQRDPLIEAVASHDRSMLRKVSDSAQAVKPKPDERNSLLEQIRTKSFNLKPAVVTKPIVQGPKTNLNVVAILEKANAIRQACAGSDEDDDADSWSDS